MLLFASYLYLESMIHDIAQYKNMFTLFMLPAFAQYDKIFTVLMPAVAH
jgi:hypothetical protein